MTMMLYARVRRSVALLAAAGLLSPAAIGVSAEAISLGSLLQEMADRDQVARFPSPAYVCRQFSSYDRDTKAPGQPGWFANWDRSQFVRVEQTQGRREYVLMDAAGPGAVVRFWGTWHGPGGGPFSNGTMRVYLDGDLQPAIKGPMADLISGDALAAGPLSESVSPETPYARRGHNLFLPIPYAKHCKITYESDKLTDIGGRKGEALYYQINYRTYDPGAQIVTFSQDQLQQLKPLVARVGRRLIRSGVDGADQLASRAFDGRLAPGEERTIEVKGPAAVRELKIRLQAQDLEQASRSTVLEIAFDGEQTVWCPIGDFFGIGYRVSAYRSWYTQVTDDGAMTAFWVMPFGKSCRLTARNLGRQSVELAETAVKTGGWSWDERSLLFHAAWRQYTKIDTGSSKNATGEGALDVNYVEVSGKGRYVGDTLTLFNGTAAWWGEGDEKIYLDGESTPSHIGTGTEDYYGYAWCRPEYFQAPFHAQPTGSGNLAGGLSVNSRYRSLDSLPFFKSIKFDMELWHWRPTRMNYAPTTFWYARPGATCNVAPDPKTAGMPVARKRTDVVDIVHVSGAIEGETLKILEKTGGVTEVQEIGGLGWSGDQQIWWRDAKPGDRLVLEAPVEAAGVYQVSANLTKARDYGVVRITLNDQVIEKTFDRYATSVSHDRLDLGRLSLKEGPNRLEVEIVDANPKAVKRYMFGLDYLKLDKAE